MALSLVTAPASEPLTLDQVKAHCLISSVTDQDEYLQRLVSVVRERAEQETERALLLQTWSLTLDGFPRESWIEIPKPPLVAVSAVRYLDMSNAWQVWPSTSYLVDAPAGPLCRRGRVSLPFSCIWPIVRPQAGCVVVEFTCGYGTQASAVPSSLVQAMLLDAAFLYQNREGVLTAAREQAIEVPRGVADTYRLFRSHQTQRWPILETL